MKVAMVGAQNAPHELACTHWSGIKAAAKRLPFELSVFCCRSGDQFIDDIIDWGADVVIYNLLDMAKDEMLPARERIKKTGAKTVFWYTDCRNEQTGQITVDISPTVDLFLTSNDGLKDFQKEHFGMTPQWLPQAAEPTPTPVYDASFADDFVFVGGIYRREGFDARADIVTDLIQNHGLKLYNGGGAEERAHVYDAMPLIYGSARFTLDISHFWDIPKYTSNRFWVIPAFWGFGLTKRFPDHEQLVPETHHVYWDTKEELLEKMDYYRAHEDERQKMIQKGWEYARDHHTYEHRLRKIIEMLCM